MTDENTDPDNPIDEVKTGPKVSRRFARLYVLALFTIILCGVVGAWYFGVINPSANPDLTQPVEWIIKGLTVLFLFFSAAMVVRAVGLGFVKGVIRAVARVAHNYELPDFDDE